MRVEETLVEKKTRKKRKCEEKEAEKRGQGREHLKLVGSRDEGP